MGRGRRIGRWQHPSPPFSLAGHGNGTRKGAKTVARVFRGEFHQKVDGKGRVSIPAGFRRVLESQDPDWQTGKRPRFVIVYGDERRKHLE